ncbi:MAG: hypothetical protein J6Y78_15985 [Paludibacteraceae bacterium]|nr:hypothetical protein [Paludibacteraceae bacterium]
MSQDFFKKCEDIIRDHLQKLTGRSFDESVYTNYIEKQKTDRDKILDCKYGIDYEFRDVKTNELITTLAWRATVCRYTGFKEKGVYNAFSLRERRNNDTPKENCELYKRLAAIENDSLRPEYMSQVLFDPLDNNSLLSLATAKIDDILEAYKKGYYRDCDKYNKDKKVYMKDVSWKLMWQAGYEFPAWFRDVCCVTTQFLDVGKNEYKVVV